MSTVLAVAVAAGFLWSILLFFAAVFLREREQDAGFGWALAGAVLFAIVFADRLPVDALGARDALTLLPGVTAAHEHFTSSELALWLLAIVYLFRVAVFYQLFLKDGKTIDEDGDEDLVNDVVAPALSYVCFAICLVSLLVPAYGLDLAWTVLLVGLLAAAHYWPLLRVLEQYLRNLRALVVVGWARLRRGLRRVVLGVIVAIMRLESPRYRNDRRALSAWAANRMNALRQEDERARIIEDQMIKKAARHSPRRPRKTKRKAAR